MGPPPTPALGLRSFPRTPSRVSRCSPSPCLAPRDRSAQSLPYPPVLGHLRLQVPHRVAAETLGWRESVGLLPPAPRPPGQSLAGLSLEPRPWVKPHPHLLLDWSHPYHSPERAPPPDPARWGAEATLPSAPAPAAMRPNLASTVSLRRVPCPCPSARRSSFLS